MNSHILHYDPYKYENSEELRDFIAWDELKKLVEWIEKDVVIVLGWDGSMLTAIQKYHPEGKKFLGINFWTKWFLMNSKKSIRNNEFVEKKYSLLETRVKSLSWEKIWLATNEVNIQAAWGKICTLKIELSGRKAIDISGDGILVSTPIGSTGYSSSLWGPIIPHNIPAFLITPKAPWKPKWQAPIIIHEDETIHIQDQERRFWVDIYTDSRLLSKDEKDVRITIKKHPTPLTLLIAHSELRSWEAKVFEEQGFK